MTPGGGNKEKAKSRFDSSGASNKLKVPYQKRDMQPNSLE